MKEGVVVPGAAREIVQLLPKIGVPAGPVVQELGARFPLEGRNLPAGPAVRAGFFSRVSVF